MWYSPNNPQVEILKITGIKSFYMGEDSYVEIICGDERYAIDCYDENSCQALFNKLLKNLNNPNKIFRYGCVEDLVS